MVAAPLPSPSPTGPMKRGWRGRGDGGPPNKRPPGGPIPSTLRVLLRSIVRVYNIINNLIMTPYLSLGCRWDYWQGIVLLLLLLLFSLFLA